MVVMAPSAVQAPVDIAESLEPEPVISEANTNATRHLSAGAYLDPEFCLTALREVYYKTKRVVAPSYGFNAITVLGHCLRARRGLAVRDVVLAGLLGIRPPLAVVGLVALVFLVPAAARAWGRFQVRALAPDRAPHPPVATRRLADIEQQMGGNTVIYSGYQPFVGSGENLWHWNFAQRLVRTPPKGITLSEAEREFDQPPFTAREISAYGRDHIAGLAHEPWPEPRLPRLTVADRNIVAGSEVSDLRPHTPQDQVARIIRNPTAPQRHYVTSQVVSWRGELVTTVYVHFAVQGKVLYVELHITGLLPCDERYRVVDQLDGTSFKRVLRDAADGLLSAPTVVASAPIGLVRAGSDA